MDDAETNACSGRRASVATSLSRDKSLAGHRIEWSFTRRKTLAPRVQAAELDAYIRQHALSRDKMIGKWRIGKLLGRGKWSKVFLGTNGSAEAAVKIINKREMLSDGLAEQLRREAVILRALNHLHIVSLYHVVETHDSFCMVLQYAAGGDLWSLVTTLGGLPVDRVKKIGAQIMSALAYCHLRYVAHRDVKPENILLDDQGNALLADFGLGTEFTHGATLSSGLGTFQYCAPEVMDGKYKGASADMWSMGCVLYYAVSGKYPFKANTNFESYQKMKSGLIEMDDRFSPLLQDLISRLLVVEPSDRASAALALQHSFFDRERQRVGPGCRQDHHRPLLPKGGSARRSYSCPLIVVASKRTLLETESPASRRVSLAPVGHLLEMVAHDVNPKRGLVLLQKRDEQTKGLTPKHHSERKMFAIEEGDEEEEYSSEEEASLELDSEEYCPVLEELNTLVMIEDVESEDDDDLVLQFRRKSITQYTRDRQDEGAGSLLSKKHRSSSNPDLILNHMAEFKRLLIMLRKHSK